MCWKTSTLLMIRKRSTTCTCVGKSTLLMSRKRSTTCTCVGKWALAYELKEELYLHMCVKMSTCLWIARRVLANMLINEHLLISWKKSTCKCVHAKQWLRIMQESGWGVDTWFSFCQKLLCRTVEKYDLAEVSNIVFAYSGKNLSRGSRPLLIVKYDLLAVLPLKMNRVDQYHMYAPFITAFSVISLPTLVHTLYIWFWPTLRMSFLAACAHLARTHLAASTHQDTRPLYLGLARTIYLNRRWPYVWWFPC